jgi:hypothetical protein
MAGDSPGNQGSLGIPYPVTSVRTNVLAINLQQTCPLLLPLSTNMPIIVALFNKHAHYCCIFQQTCPLFLPNFNQERECVDKCRQTVLQQVP